MKRFTTTVLFLVSALSAPAFAGMTRDQISQVADLGRQIGRSDAALLGYDIAIARKATDYPAVMPEAVREQVAKERNAASDKLKIVLDMVDKNQAKNCYYAVTYASRQGQGAGLAEGLETVGMTDVDAFKRTEFSSLKYNRSAAAAGLKAAMNEAEALCK